ncbi:MAG: hypothetical protein ACLPQS_16440 [Acidimicrobiales bacterium]
MKKRKSLIAIAATTGAVLLGSGVAFAAWSASGTGSGAGRALTAQSLVVTAVAPGPVGASLYPGGPAGWVYLTIQNPNPYGVNVTGLSWGTPTSGDTTDCPNTNISVDATAPTTANIPVPADSTSEPLQIFGVLDLAGAAPNGCQGVVFTVPVTVSGTQT